MKSIIVYTYMFLLIFFASMIMTSVYSVDKDKQNISYFMDVEEGNDGKSKKATNTIDDFVHHTTFNIGSLKTKIVKMASSFLCMYDYFHLNKILQPPQIVL